MKQDIILSVEENKNFERCGSMATTTDRLPISHKHYLKPTQNSRATWLDEVKFVEEMIENPIT